MSKIIKDLNQLTVEDQINEIEKQMFYTSNKPTNAHRKGAKFYTELEFYNELGEKLFDDHNELLIPGGLFTLAKISGQDPPINMKTINTDLSLNAVETAPGYTGPRREDVIIGFMIGIDGCTDIFDTVSPVTYNERTIKSLIPFRKVEKTSDLSTAEKASYFMKKDDGTYYNYYLKAFETTPKIHAEYDETGYPAVPSNPEDGAATRIINTYLQYTLKISADDVRDYFKISGGGLRKARVNTLGLVHGYPSGTGDFKGVQMFSKINFNNEAFDNETKELTIIYKIYV